MILSRIYSLLEVYLFVIQIKKLYIKYQRKVGQATAEDHLYLYLIHYIHHIT